VATDSELVERYLEYVRTEKRLAQRTVELYALDLGKLQSFAAGSTPIGASPASAGGRGKSGNEGKSSGAPALALCEVSHHHIRRWIAMMHSGGRSGRGIALILSGWRGFYVWLGRQGLVASNPVQDVRAPKAPKPLPKAMGVDEAVQFADFQSEDGAWFEARDAAMVELLYGSGLRVGELLGLDVQPGPQAKGWIDLQEAQAHVLGKGGKRRSVPVGSAALRALERWLALRATPPGLASGSGATGQAEAALTSAPQTALFTGRNGTRLSAASVWQRLQRRSQLAHTSAPVHPHMLRHSFASHVLQSSSDLRGVQELLGHANISTTQVYTRLDFQHLAKAYDAAHPRAKSK
jgi:integrase/recombinase XerC